MYPLCKFLNNITLEVNINTILLNYGHGYHPVIIQVIISLEL
jgi:hypothetical protein